MTEVGHREGEREREDIHIYIMLPSIWILLL